MYIRTSVANGRKTRIIKTTFFYIALFLFKSKRNIQPKICILFGHWSYLLISSKVVHHSTHFINHDKFFPEQINSLSRKLYSIQQRKWSTLPTCAMGHHARDCWRRISSGRLSSSCSVYAVWTALRNFLVRIELISSISFLSFLKKYSIN